MHKRIVNSEYHVLPHAAHLSNLENAPEFNKHLIGFLNRVK
jgi:pimeloyl-ACP methyl ester carboxylesterase